MTIRTVMPGALGRLATRGVKAGVLAGVLAGMLALGAPAAQAAYPERPVEMTVLFGGTANTIAQMLSELMSDQLGNPVVPVSRPGGGGAVGYSHVESSDADGYSIVWNSNSINTAAHTGRVPFDYTAFTPIARVSVETPALAVNAATGWSSLDDLKAAAMEADHPLRVGISGKGSFTHLASAALFDAMGIGDKVNYIAYGDGKAPVELMAGRIDAAIQWPGQFKSYMETGDLAVLAVTGADRIDVLPEVKTAQEQGVDVDITMWRGLAGPAGMSPEVVGKLAAAVQAATESEEFLGAAENVGFTPAYMGPEEFGALIASDDAFYAKLLDQLGMARK